jgi:preprotein translocase SecE subunit
MALGIYKPEQGYWVRVMTACLVAAITLATSGWLWNQASVIDERILPRTTHAMAVNVTTGTPTPAQGVELLGQPPTPEAPAPIIGTAEVLTYSADGRVLRIGKLKLTEKHNSAEITGIRAGTNLAAAVVPSTFKDEPFMDLLYIRLILVGITILVGTAIAYYIAALRPQTVDFLIATDSEMKRVNWSTWREIRGSTLVVVAACFSIAGALFLFDLFFQTVFKAGGVLAQ